MNHWLYVWILMSSWLAVAAPQLLLSPGASLSLPDFELPIEILGLKATVNANNITCNDIVFKDDLNIAWDIANEEATLNVELLGFSTSCTFDYSYTSPLGANAGTAIIVTDQNALQLAYASANPKNSDATKLASCEPTIELQGIQFNNDEPLKGVFEEVMQSDSLLGGVSLGDYFATSLCNYFEDPVALDSFIGGDDEAFSTFGLLTEFAKEDPTSTEREEADEKMALVDFQGSTSWPGAGVKAALDLLSYLNDSSNGGSSQVNQLLGLFLDEQGVFRMDISMEFSSGENTLRVNQFQIRGLESLDGLNDIRAIGKHTLQVDMSLSNLTVSVSGVLLTSNATTPMDVSVEANVTTLDGAFAFYIPIDEVSLGDIPIAALLERSTATTCLGSTVNGIAIADTQMRSLQFTPSNSPDWELIQDAGIVIDLESLLGSQTGKSRRSVSKCGRPRYFNSESAFLDFRDLFLPVDEALEYGTKGLAPYGNSLAAAKAFIDDALVQLYSDSSSLSLAEAMTVRSGMSTLKESSLFLSIGFLGMILGDQQAYVLEPLKNQSTTLTNSLSTSNLDVQGAAGVRFDELSVRDEWKFQFNSEFIAVYLQTMSYVFEQAFLDFPIRDMLNINCWMTTIPQGIDEADVMFAIERASMELGSFDLDLECVNCHKTAASSIAFSVDPSMGFQSHIDNFLSVFQGHPSKIDPLLQKMFRNAPIRCPHHPSFDSSQSTREFQLAKPTILSTNKTFIVLIVVLVVLFLCLSAFYHFLQPKLIHRRNGLGTTNVETTRLANEISRHDNSTLLATVKRYTVPFMAMLSNAMFILGVTQTAFLFRLYIDIAEQHFMVLDIRYSITRLVREFWMGGGWMFALVIILFGLFIPLIRNTCLLLIQLSPLNTTHLGQTRFILKCLNFFGKWVIGTFFISIIAAASLSILVVLPFTTTTGLNVVQARGLMPPVYGMFLWVVAQIISQWSGEAVLRDISSVGNGSRHMYSKGMAQTISSTENELSPVGQPNGSCQSALPVQQNSLSSQVYTSCNATEEEHLKVSFAANAMISIASVMYFILLTLGIFLPCVSFRQQGLLVPESSDKAQFSVASMVAVFSDNAKYSNSPALRFYTGITSFLLVTFVVVVPALEFSLLLLLWFRRQSETGLSRLWSATRWLRVFGYTEIFVVAVVVATSQITMIVEFLVGRNCEAFAGIISVVVDIGIIEPEDAFCYDVVGMPREASVFLLLAGFVLICMRTFVGEAVASSPINCVGTVEERASETEEDPTPAFTNDDVSFPGRFRYFFRPA